MDDKNEEKQQGMSARDEYFAKLAEWVKEVHAIRTANLMFMHHLVVNYPQLFQAPHPAPPLPLEQPTPEVELPAGPSANVFVVAPLWKRTAAEAIDRMIIGVLQLVLTLLLSSVLLGLHSVNYVGLFNDLVLLNLLSEIPRSCLEALWCYSFAGVTPGKALLGICVLQGASIVPIQLPGLQDLQDPPKVVIHQAQPPSLMSSFRRSLAKNILSMLFLPLFLMFAIKTQRTAQDVLTKTIVVETVPGEHF
ncbi:uncharacterized protein LOC108048464 [Drosophila rhopaloa]|uniref:Uncharacterized protein LOC108048464 n=1 Tax=Drosophila rhopaloa TaxID=1041015 RepID=A0A6P4F2L4_DRORH|nr:uncharacterized protein LOC108048464 [Drosophila rhopaloa]